MFTDRFDLKLHYIPCVHNPFFFLQCVLFVACMGHVKLGIGLGFYQLGILKTVPCHSSAAFCFRVRIFKFLKYISSTFQGGRSIQTTED